MFGYMLTMQSLMRRRGDRFDWRWTTPGWVMKRGSRSGWSRSGMMEESMVKRKGHSGMMEGFCRKNHPTIPYHPTLC